MDAAKSGESARLKAAIESLKGDFVHQKQEHVCISVKVFHFMKARRTKIS